MMKKPLAIVSALVITGLLLTGARPALAPRAGATGSKPWSGPGFPCAARATRATTPTRGAVRAAVRALVGTLPSSFSGPRRCPRREGAGS